MGEILVLATSNRSKFDEIDRVFRVPGVDLVSLKDYPDIADSPEEGDSFEEIACGKAEYYFQAIEKPVLTEDSGLVIPSLGGFPGIYSARIAGDDPARIQLVLDRLRALEQKRDSIISDESRRAFYACTMALRTSNGIWTTEGRCFGFIRNEPQGTGGFGYDPIFQPDGSDRTFGGMSREEKAQFSHRIRALMKMMSIVRTTLGGGK